MNETGIQTCGGCGQRPASVAVRFTTPRGEREALLCERCANVVVARSGGAATPAGAPRGAAAAGPQGDSRTPALDEFGRDLTAEARAGRIDPVIGRDEEIEQAVEILARRR